MALAPLARSPARVITTAVVGKSARKQGPRGSEDGSSLGQSVEDEDRWRERRFSRRLSRFYARYDRTKLQDVEALAAKYATSEEKLFAALTSKYGPEPEYDDEDADSIATDFA